MPWPEPASTQAATSHDASQSLTHWAQSCPVWAYPDTSVVVAYVPVVR
jgi:hypothetical protein